jgi:hypothetical protein
MPGLVPGDADLSCSYLDFGPAAWLAARIQKAGNRGFYLFAQFNLTNRFNPYTAYYLGHGQTGPNGRGETFVKIPVPSTMSTNYEVTVFAVYRSMEGGMRYSEPAHFIVCPKPLEVMDFEWGAGSVPLKPGLTIADQWSDIGIHISAKNNTKGHPDKAILFNSTSPTGDDPDLVTPGYGLMNHEAFGNLLIIPEDDVDLNFDGLVDDPDDERYGGTITFDFDNPVQLYEIVLIDVDMVEISTMKCYAGGRMMADVQPYPAGDNSCQRIGFGAEKVDRLEVSFTGSGGIAELSFVPCREEVVFDRTLTGIPLWMRAGEKMSDQFQKMLGFEIRAFCIPYAGPLTYCEPHTPILFNSAKPTGGDFDLRTPGPHPSNNVAREQVMILAENVIDMNGDGYVDVPDDDSEGGVMVLDFEYDIVFQSGTVIDVDLLEHGWFYLFDKDDVRITRLPLPGLGNNSSQTVTGPISGVRKVVLFLSSSAALADFQFCRDESELQP